VAAAVGARCLLTDEVASAVLAEFLRQRDGAFAQQAAEAAKVLSHATSADADVTSALCNLVGVVQVSVAMAGELFGDFKAGESTAAARAILAESEVLTELTFDELEVQEKYVMGSEVDMWKARVAAAATRLTPLTAEAVARAVVPWLDSLSKAVDRPLTAVSSCQGLATVAVGVQEMEGTWRGPGGCTWQEVMHRVLGRDISLWHLVMEPGLSRRAQHIVFSRVDSSVRACLAVLHPCLLAAAKGAVDAPGAARAAASNWSAVPVRTVAATASPGAPSHRRTAAAASWRGGAAEAATSLESGVRSALADASALLRTRPIVGNAEAVAGEGRGRALAGSVHEACASSMKVLAQELMDLREKLPKAPSPGYADLPYLHSLSHASCWIAHV
jgi:hypothetical protein